VNRVPTQKKSFENCGPCAKRGLNEHPPAATYGGGFCLKDVRRGLGRFIRDWPPLCKGIKRKIWITSSRGKRGEASEIWKRGSPHRFEAIRKTRSRCLRWRIWKGESGVYSASASLEQKELE